MKKEFRNLFMVAFAAILGLCITSCSKDNDEKESENDTKTEQENSNYKEEAIDLGLSVKWATCNIGATKPWESGDYICW